MRLVFISSVMATSALRTISAVIGSIVWAWAFMMERVMLGSIREPARGLCASLPGPPRVLHRLISAEHRIGVGGEARVVPLAQVGLLRDQTPLDQPVLERLELRGIQVAVGILPGRRELADELLVFELRVLL